MGRSILGVIAGIGVIFGFSLLAGYFLSNPGLIPSEIAAWLAIIGFFIGCAIIGLVGELTAGQALILSLLGFVGIIIFLALVEFMWTTLLFGPIALEHILLAWNEVHDAILGWIPFLGVIDDIALTAGGFVPISMLSIIIRLLISFSLIGIIGLIIAAVGARFTRSSVHVVAAPEVTSDYPESTIPSEVPAPTSMAVDVPAESVSAPPAMAPVAAPLPPPSQSMPAPRPVEDSLPKGTSPSAKAISGLKGKATKHLKSPKQKAPSGQARCPHCMATVIQGSRFCNACEREF